MTDHIGFLGTGLMGAPMAARLLETGHQVTVWNRTASKTADLRTAGARVAATPAEVVASGEVVICVLADGRALETTVFGTDSRPRLRGRSLIQMGTIGPDESRAFADRASELGADWLEAPVLGSGPQAADGTLLVMVGGERDLYARHEALLRSFGTPRLIGPVGHAATLKLAMNQLIGSLTAAYASSLALVRQAGVDVDAYVDIVRASALHAPTFDKKLANMLTHNYAQANFPARHLLKDVRLYLKVVEDQRLAADPVVGLAKVLERTLEMGLGDADYSALAEALAEIRGS